MAKIKIEGSIEEELVEEFERLAFNAFGPHADYKDEALKEALKDWIDKKRV